MQHGTKGDHNGFMSWSTAAVMQVQSPTFCVWSPPVFWFLCSLSLADTVSYILDNVLPKVRILWSLGRSIQELHMDAWRLCPPIEGSRLHRLYLQELICALPSPLWVAHEHCFNFRMQILWQHFCQCKSCIYEMHKYCTEHFRTAGLHSLFCYSIAVLSKPE